ncbi:TPA: hypothetical protein DCZ36_02030 [Candidatus Gracilibacteria bacterium]|nr:hypothetical protein [Candidatus Gracilibacteria bacterium]
MEKEGIVKKFLERSHLLLSSFFILGSIYKKRVPKFLRIYFSSATEDCLSFQKIASSTGKLKLPLAGSEKIYFKTLHKR